METKIGPTNHALERFEERIKPRLIQSHRERIQNQEEILLASYCDRLKKTDAIDGTEKFEVLFEREGRWPLILIFVIDFDNGILKTLWCLGEKNNSQKGRMN